MNRSIRQGLSIATSWKASSPSWERRSAEFQIERKVWVRMSDSEVEKLRGRKPRDKAWRIARMALGWLIAVGAGLASNFGGIPPYAQLLGLDDGVAGLWSDEIQIGLSCTSLDPGGDGHSRVEPQVATIAAIFDSAKSAAAMESPARSIVERESGGARGTLHRLGNTLFYRTASGSVKDAKPVYDTWCVFQPS